MDNLAVVAVNVRGDFKDFVVISDMIDEFVDDMKAEYGSAFGEAVVFAASVALNGSIIRGNFKYSVK